MRVTILSSRCSIGSPEHLVPGAAPVSSRCPQAPAGDHGPVLNQAIEYRSNAQSAIISAFQLSAIFAKPSTTTAAPTPNPHSRQAFTAFPRVRSSEAFRRRPYTGSIARAGPASETLPDLRRLIEVGDMSVFGASRQLPDRLGEGPLTEPTADTRACRWELVKMPHKRHPAEHGLLADPA